MILIREHRRRQTSNHGNRTQWISHCPPIDTENLYNKHKLSPLCFRVNKVKKHFCYSFQDENNTPVAIKDAQIPDISGALSHAYGNMAKLDEKKVTFLYSKYLICKFTEIPALIQKTINKASAES